MPSSSLRTLATIALVVSLQSQADARNPLAVETRKAASAEKYLVIALNDAPIYFTTEKPNRDDANLLLAIPAGFVTKEGNPIGAWVSNGQVSYKVNPKLGGALSIIDGKFEFVDTKNGTTLTKEFLDRIAGKSGGLFQQFTIVKNRIPGSFKDPGKFLRRGIGKTVEGKEIIVESKNPITMKQYASDLVALGLKDFVYTDMGPWTESWFRDPKTGNLVDIGNEKAAQIKQANWLVVTAPDED